MLLLIDCRYRLVEKAQNSNSGQKPSTSNGPSRAVIKEFAGSPEEKEDLMALEVNGDVTAKIDEPTKPQVDILSKSDCMDGNFHSFKTNCLFVEQLRNKDIHIILVNIQRKLVSMQYKYPIKYILCTFCEYLLHLIFEKP